MYRFRRATAAWATYNEPRQVSRSTYEDAVARVLERLSGVEGLLAVYQLGSVSVPGISDIDLLVVFEDEVCWPHDPLDGLDPRARSLFTHSLFGLPRRYLGAVRRFGVSFEYRLRWGTEPQVEAPPLKPAENARIRYQLALEYLILNYIARSIENVYRTLNVRGILLSANAIRFDLQLLGIQSGPIAESVQQIIEWRKTWFEARLTGAVLPAWFEAFYPQLGAMVESLLEKQPLYMPSAFQPRYARHVLLRPGSPLTVHHNGVLLPRWLMFLGHKFARLQNRFNAFEFVIPLSPHGDPLMAERFQASSELARYNRKAIPRFISPLSGLFATTS